MRRNLPNTLTCCNLISGCIAVYSAFHGQIQLAFLCIVLGAIFDFFDGFAARLLEVSSSIGKELDSLADVITFGLAPAALAFHLFEQVRPHGWSVAGSPSPISFVVFLLAAFSALRLAKFNLDERQSSSFIGLPTPANALFWASAALWLSEAGLQRSSVLAFVILMAVAVSCYALICELPMFALKFKTYAWKGNEVRYGFVLISACLLLLLQWSAFLVIIPLYFVVSIATNLLTVK